MIDTMAVPPNHGRAKLKEKSGWFAAGEGFRKALTLLSDGAFRLFAYVSFQADHRTGRLEATHQELAAALGKSKRIIGCYVDELERAKVCTVRHGKNQYAPGTLEISDSYWPYERVSCSESAECKTYIDAIREDFLALGCVAGRFGAADVRMAEDLQRRTIPLAVVRQALLLGACRKYGSWLENGSSGPIRTLYYFRELIEEILKQPLPAGYEAYLRRKVKQLAQMWSETNAQPAPKNLGTPEAAFPQAGECWRKKVTSTRPEKETR
jgi:hypothetical protein